LIVETNFFLIYFRPHAVLSVISITSPVPHTIPGPITAPPLSIAISLYLLRGPTQEVEKNPTGSSSSPGPLEA